MTSPSKRYDIAIVGGGITGAGIARDAALRGLRVALFEKGDYGSGTSSKSSKLIHGGLRYLEHGEVGLVFESVSERRVQARLAPHLVRPLPFLVPIYQGMRPGLELMNIGLWIYDTLAMFRSPRLHRTFRGRRAGELEPNLRSDDLRGAIEYYDCIADDARLVLENILDARSLGADCRSYTEVTSVDRDAGGRVCGVAVRDLLTGAEETVPAHAVIVAGGPWTDRVLERLGAEPHARILRPTKGVHLVFPRDKLPLERAITLISPVDRRVMFAIPWRGRTVIGTTDTDFDGDPDEVHATAEDARYLCDSANAYFPNANFRPEEVIATWAGLRPLVDDEAARASDVSREHQIFNRGDGVFVIAGGKLTTYRLMAKEVLDGAVAWLADVDSDLFEGRWPQRSRTKKRPLPGARGLTAPTQDGIARVAAAVADRHELGEETAAHLARVYGERAGAVAAAIDRAPALADRIDPELPYVWAEIEFAAREDLARTVTDVLSRRVPLLLTARDQGLGAAERVADVLAGIHGWPDDERARQLGAYRDVVAQSRRFRDAEPGKVSGARR